MNFKKTNWCTDEETILHCPLCQGDHNHLIDAREEEGGVQPCKHITLTFICAEGHMFYYNLSENKGCLVSTFGELPNLAE